MSLTSNNHGRPWKPFQYPWAFDFYKKQQKISWIPEEVPMGQDVVDYKNKITDNERNLITQIFRFFVTADQEVGNNYHQRYLNTFTPNEVQMMLLTFANTESLHQEAYALLIDTVGLPETEYSQFMKYKEMKDKFDYFSQFTMENPTEIAKTIAAFGAFTEGLQLFASFAILLSFSRFNLMKGMGQIITWSIRDEDLHCQGIITLYHTFLQEHPEIDKLKLEQDIVEICKEIVRHEDAFIELAFGDDSDIRGLTSQQIKDYIRYIANYRLMELGIAPIYSISVNPLPWIAKIINSVEHANFFESRVTTYSRGNTGGDWDEAFS